MNRSTILLSSLLFGAVLGAGTLQLHAQGGPPTPERQAEMAKQKALEDATPQLQFTEEILPLSIPGHTLGETEGVNKNSQGHLFVYSRTGKGGSARGGTAAELFEFDQNYKFVKEWAPDAYSASFAHSVRNDKYDNVWVVDEGSDMIVKYNKEGVLQYELGRKPEAIDYLEQYLERGEKNTNRYPVGTMGSFNRETDIAWDENDNSYISDGYGNSRFVKIDKNGVWQKAVGTHGNGQDQFSTPHGIAVDQVSHLVLVGDRGNSRIPVYDYNMNYVKTITGMAAPWSVQVTPKYYYSGDGTGKIYRFDHSGKLLGWIQTGLNQGQTGCMIHEMYAESDTVLYRGACSEWNVEKITFKN